MAACIRHVSKKGRIFSSFVLSLRSFSRVPPLHCAEAGETYSQQDEDGDEIKRKILNAALPYVHEHGWTSKALAAGAEQLGLPSITHGLFPREGAELVHHFYFTCNQELDKTMREWVEEADLDESRVKRTAPFIRDSLEVRLRMLDPYMDRWPQAMAIMALPQNCPEALKNLTSLVDSIWHHAGDKSVDFNWYTKRGSLAVVYKSTELFMINDDSDDYYETWEFLDRRIDEFERLGSLKKQMDENGTVLVESLRSAGTLARNVLGLNSRNR